MSRNGDDTDPKAALIQERILQKFTWRKVTAPKPWHPKPGDEIAGFYGGKSVKNGKFGQYQAVLVRIPGSNPIMVTGARIVQLIDAAMVEIGAPIHITYGGKKDIGNDRTMNLFELQVADDNDVEAAFERREREFAS